MPVGLYPKQCPTLPHVSPKFPVPSDFAPKWHHIISCFLIGWLPMRWWSMVYTLKLESQRFPWMYGTHPWDLGNPLQSRDVCYDPKKRPTFPQFTLMVKLWFCAKQAVRHYLDQWRHKVDRIIMSNCFNYADPVYGVATICHQVRCLCWGHPSLFHTATSFLIWYKMFCMRYISYRLIWMKCINMLSVYAQSGTHKRFNWWIIAVLT